MCFKFLFWSNCFSSPNKQAMLSILDGCVVAGYLLLVVAIGLGSWFFGSSSRDHTPKKHDGGGGAAEYFLAGRSIPFWAVGMSLFSSNIGSEHFIGS